MTLSDTDHHQTAAPTSALSPEAFKDVFRHHPAGVTVITLADQGRLYGFTATSVISVSAAPPLLAFSVAGSSSSWAALSRTSSVVVNFLSADQVEISARFATSGIDRFGVGGWSLLETGEPVLDDSPHWLRARILDRIPVGSSQLVCLEATDAGHSSASAPLVYHDRLYHGLGEHSSL